MKKIVLFVLSVVALLVSATVYSQNQPVSFKHSELLSEIDNVVVASPDMVQIMNEDAQNEKNGVMYRTGVGLDVNVNMQNCGTTDILADGTKVWRLKLTSYGAMALKLMFDYFYIPDGASLFVYNENRLQLMELTSKDNPKYGNYFSPRFVQGGDAYLEYVQPVSVVGTPRLEMSTVMYHYRGVESFVGYYQNKREPGGQSESCEVNVNCPVGSGWQTQKKGVAEIYCVITGNFGMLSAGSCTGTLVNNTSNDGTPYFLTADHCGGESGDGHFNQWEFYFNYEASGCTNPTSEPQYQTVTGCTRKARPTGAESTGTDFLLLQLNTTEDNLETIGAYYNGWDRSSTGAQSGACIHHPAGDIKKISFFTQQLTPGTYNNDAPNGHWLTMWQNNNSDITGVTEPGSSGSPLFGANKLVVGTLTGGSSNCSATGQNRSDMYGRFDLHWENGGTSNANRLKPWLDPNNTGAETCEGRFPGSGTDPNPPDPNTLTADFTANPTTVERGGTVAFRDASTGNPTSWSWIFQGGNPSTSTSQNPSVVYQNPGTYNVTLTVSNANGEDTRTKNAYITVSENGNVPDPNGELSAAFVASSYNITIGECINFTDRSSGSPTSWTWTFQGAETVTSNQQNPTNICYNTPGAYNVTLYVQNADGDYDSEVCEGCIIVENNPTLPIADFEANITVIPVGGVVRFTNLSQNGPFDQWAWHFYGGTPETSSDSVPPIIAYTEIGTYDVELRCRKTNGIQDIELKQGYIRVVPQSDQRPEANFTSNKTLVRPGETVEFIDLSTANPYRWNWVFEGGTPAASNQPNPSVVYTTEGTYNVKLTVSNNIGADEITKEMYIVVSATDPCTEPPVADFSAVNRNIAYGTEVFFENLSTNGVAYSSWTFEGGSPRTSTEFSPTSGVLYSTPGIYDVTLLVSNSCGSSTITKERYVYVFNSGVASYCDTLSNVSTGDVIGGKSVSGTWGYYAGQNGKKIKGYADYFNTYTFTQVEALLVPVTQAVYGSTDASVRFYVWADDNGKPGEELGNKKVLIRNLSANQTNVVRFNEPVLVNGPFHVGFKVNYTDSDNDDVSDDLFVVPVVTNRPANGLNTMSVLKNNVWYSTPEFLSFNTTLPIEPVSCLTGIEELEAEENAIDVYPNPTTGLLNISFGNAETEGYSVEIYDALGRLVSSENVSASDNHSMDISAYPEGLYIVRISTPAFVANKKIMLTK